MSNLALRVALVALATVAVGAALYVLIHSAPENGAGVARPLKVLAYSGFVNSWGPGPELAKQFKLKSGISIEFQDGGDAGLILRKLELFPADLVLGFDQLTVPAAQIARGWRTVADLTVAETYQMKAAPAFVPFDWSPLTFNDRKDGTIAPPKSLDDLADARFHDAIALEDPRTTTPGLQFLFWVLDEKGVDEGFLYLQRLRPSVHAVYPSWSEAYGAFTKKQTPFVFSYLTSPIYHLLQEKDSGYRAEIFSQGLPVQVEYFAIPESCANCVAAESFARFLLSPEAQKTIMEKNVMLPVLTAVAVGTPYGDLLHAPVRTWKSLNDLLARREELLSAGARSDFK